VSDAVTEISPPCTSTRSTGMVVGRGGERFEGYLFTGKADDTPKKGRRQVLMSDTLKTSQTIFWKERSAKQVC